MCLDHFIFTGLDFSDLPPPHPWCIFSLNSKFGRGITKSLSIKKKLKKNSQLALIILSSEPLPYFLVGYRWCLHSAGGAFLILRTFDWTKICVVQDESYRTQLWSLGNITELGAGGIVARRQKSAWAHFSSTALKVNHYNCSFILAYLNRIKIKQLSKAQSVSHHYKINPDLVFLGWTLSVEWYEKRETSKE